jgi:DNA-binding transcriptional MerR regulator
MNDYEIFNKEEHMGEKRFIISDAAKLVDVESHVLRYWEEELGIEIPRNEMGHRYYEESHIALLKNVKELKDCGYQLKAIKMLVPELMEMQKDKNGNLDVLKAELFNKVARVSRELMEEQEKSEATHGSKSEKVEDLNRGAGELDGSRPTVTVDGTVSESIVVDNNQTEELHNDMAGAKTMPISGSKLEQFQMILSEVVSNVLKENTGEFGKEVSDIVSDNVIKEMDYLMHIREKQEEERFKKLDEMIRNYQMNRKEQGKQPTKQSTKQNAKQSRWLFAKAKKL